CFSLSRPTGEGRGEGKASLLLTCWSFPSALRTFVCRRLVPDCCARIPHGLKSASGNCFDPDDWLNTNSDLSVFTAAIIWPCIVMKRNWQSDWTGQVMEYLNISSATSSATTAWQHGEYWSNVYGIISLLIGRIEKIWWKISGNFCRNVLRILRTSPCLPL